MEYPWLIPSGEFVSHARAGISMTRIFRSLAAIDGLLLLVAYSLGTLSKLWDGVHQPQYRIYWFHFLFGLTASLLTLLVHCLIFTYFLGTGRWVKEVKLAYNLPDAPLYKRTRELKRLVYPVALAAMLITIGTSAAGGGVQLQGWPWALPFLLAITTV